MGLAPWVAGLKSNRKDIEKWYFGDKKQANLGLDVSSNGGKYVNARYMTGNPFEEGSFSINRELLRDLGLPKSYSEKQFIDFAHIASSVQSNLEDSALSLVGSLKALSGEDNLALTGGVALNSVLNGRICREAGFSQVYIPPGPGDEGIAVEKIRILFAYINNKCKLFIFSPLIRLVVLYMGCIE